MGLWVGVGVGVGVCVLAPVEQTRWFVNGV